MVKTTVEKEIYSRPLLEGVAIVVSMNIICSSLATTTGATFVTPGGR